jgi:hypothetical protein
LKVQYQKKTNLYTFNQLVEALGKSRTITIHPAVSEDFLDYGDIFDFFYKKLAGQIKQNHIFSLFDGSEMVLRESVLHQDFTCLIMKKGFKYLTHQEVVERGKEELRMLEREEINPYKVYKLFKNFRPYVPVEYPSDSMHAEPNLEVLAKVMAEMVDRKEFRATMKRKKYDRTKEQLENVAFGDDG